MLLHGIHVHFVRVKTSVISILRPLQCGSHAASQTPCLSQCANFAGTVICTGTPAGVGFARNPPLFLSNGDEVTVTIEGLGSLTNAVRVA